VRSALGEARVSALSADGTGSLSLLAGILLLIPGFMTDLVGLVLLLGTLLRGPRARAQGDSIIDLTGAMASGRGSRAHRPSLRPPLDLQFPHPCSAGNPMLANRGFKNLREKAHDSDQWRQG
jgi:hypothetical protein